MTWDHDAWVKAWGWNAPIIVGDNDGFPRMPALPEGCGWLITRETTPGRDGELFPTYLLTLWQGFDEADEAKQKTLTRGKIDKTMYGEAGVLEKARLMKEKYCAGRPDRSPETEGSRRRSPQGGRAAAGEGGPDQDDDGPLRSDQGGSTAP